MSAVIERSDSSGLEVSDMRLAVFSDVHSNLAALESILQDSQSQGVEQLYCLGDLIDYGPYPNEVVAAIRDRDVPTLLGNHDDGIAFERDGSGGGFHSDAERDFKEQAFAWTAEHVSTVTRAWLRRLPLNLPLDVDGRCLLLVHASPRRLNEYLYEDLPDATFTEIAASVDCEVLVFGHTHVPYDKAVSDVRFVNVGSVGNPKDGDPRACYAILDVRDSEIEVRFRRVAYDINATVAAVLRSGLPRSYVDRLRQGR